MSTRLFLFPPSIITRCLLCGWLIAITAMQSGCAFFPGLAGDQDVQAAVEKAADDPFPSAKQVGLATKKEK
jgi:hypothetical protein